MELSINTINKLTEIALTKPEYRSGPNLVDIFNSIGFNDIYGPGFPSRFSYCIEKIKEINGTEKVEKLIKILLSPALFIELKEEYNDLISVFNEYLKFDDYKVVVKIKDILIISIDDEDNEVDDNLFDELSRYNYDDKLLDKIDLDSKVIDILKYRIKEIQVGLERKLPLAVIFISGSILEGLLFGIASKYPAKFNKANAAPKNNGGVKKFSDWSLSEFINVSFELDILNLDVKKYCHILRDFRNYIHPYEQLKSEFVPDIDTAKISYQVLIAAINQISNYITQTKNDTIS